MQTYEDRYHYTPSDLVEFFESSFASWMSRFALDYPEQVKPDPDTPELATLAEQGQRHEQTLFARFRAEGRTLYAVPLAGDRSALTHAAMEDG
jgi:hypothetical protein